VTVAPMFCFCVCLFMFVAVDTYWNIHVKLGSFKSNKRSDCQLVSWPASSQSTCHTTRRKYLKDCSSSFMTTLILATVSVFLTLYSLLRKRHCWMQDIM